MRYVFATDIKPKYSRFHLKKKLNINTHNSKRLLKVTRFTLRGTDFLCSSKLRWQQKFRSKKHSHGNIHEPKLNKHYKRK